MKEKLKFRLLTGKLPSGNHHFSIVIYDRSGDEVRYFELKQKYFGEYPASIPFKRLWSYVIRPMVDVSRAVTWRAKRILARADIQPSELKYMTTVVIPASGKRPARFRHVVGVKLSSYHLEWLQRRGMVRELFRGDDSDKMRIRVALLGLSTLAMRVAKQGAKEIAA